MASSSQIRLQIATILDNSGIKATKEQIDQLQDKLSRLNSKGGGVDGLNRELTKMPGKFGKITEQMGGLAAKVGVLYAAWKAFEGGLKIGQGIFKEFSDGAGYSLESIGNGFSSLGTKTKDWITKLITGRNRLDDIKDAMEVAKANSQAAIDGATTATEKHLAAMQKVRDVHDQTIAKIKAETNAYIQQAQSVANLKGAGDNANVVMLESEKQSLMSKYQDQGMADEAEQIGKAYDLMIAKERALGTERKNNYELIKASRAIEGKASSLNEASIYTDKTYQRWQEAKAKLDAAKSGPGNATNVQVMKRWQKYADKAEQEYKDALSKEDALKNEFFSDYNSYKAMQINSAASNEAAMRDVRGKFSDYARFESTYGNLANIEFGNSVIGNIQADSIKSFESLKEIAANTKEMTSFGEILKELLSVK